MLTLSWQEVDSLHRSLIFVNNSARALNIYVCIYTYMGHVSSALRNSFFAELFYDFTVRTFVRLTFSELFVIWWYDAKHGRLWQFVPVSSIVSTLHITNWHQVYVRIKSQINFLHRSSLILIVILSRYATPEKFFVEPVGTKVLLVVDRVSQQIYTQGKLTVDYKSNSD